MSASNASILRMTDAETIRFLELYKNEPVLWDKTLDDYKRRDVRVAAAKRIADIMDIHGFTDVHVIIKFKNLRSSYLQELKKIAEARKYDEMYVPKVVWFTTMDSFLKPHCKLRSSQYSLTFDDVNFSAYESFDNTQEVFPKSEIAQQSQNVDKSYMVQQAQPVQQNPNPEPSGSGRKRKTRANVTKPSRNFRAKKCKKSSRNFETKKQITSAVEKVVGILEKIESREDSFDHFGKYITSLLRSFPAQKSFEVQEKVISLVLREHAQLGFEAGF